MAALSKLITNQAQETTEDAAKLATGAFTCVTDWIMADQVIFCGVQLNELVDSAKFILSITSFERNCCKFGN